MDIAEGEPGLRLAPTGLVAMVDEGAAVRQGILLLLSTRPGERVMRPKYGCNLHRLLFSPNDDTTAGLAIHYVRDALRRWEPRITILSVDAGQNPNVQGMMDITLHYRLRSSQGTESLILSLNLGEPA
jgi:phage baseplate assembly protein W